EPEPRQQSASRQAPVRQAPVQQVAGFDYTVQRGDTVSALARQHGTTVAAIVSANGLPNGGWLILVGQNLFIPGSTPEVKTYTVESGDVLYRIARSNGVTVEAIAEANNLSNPDLILVGQQLEIPSS
nr:LysM peptidoglycan-binding domain-containing protein [Actinomycetota bacterium]